MPINITAENAKQHKKVINVSDRIQLKWQEEFEFLNSLFEVKRIGTQRWLCLVLA